VVGLELLPLGLVRVRDDDGVDVDHAVAARRGDDLLLRRRDHGVEVLGLVLEDLDELDDAAVADVERAVQVEHARVALAVDVELRDVLAADQTDVSWLFGSTGGTTPMPVRLRFEKYFATTGNSS
jgi:hypothetical protein